MKKLLAFIANHSGLVDTYGYLRRFTTPQTAIICYHSITEPGTSPFASPLTVQEFEKQMKYLRMRCEVMPLQKMIKYVRERKALPAKAAAITFDDGYKDNYRYAYPVLKRYGLPATFYLATSNVDNRKLFWWDQVSYIMGKTRSESFEIDGIGKYHLRSDSERLRAARRITERLKELPDERKNLLLEKVMKISGVDIPAGLGREMIMSWDEIREMAANGMDFGAHTVSHPILTKIPLKLARMEITGSKRHIEEKIRKPVTTFAYPNGTPTDFNADVKKILKENGFTSAVTFAPSGLVNSGTDPYEIKRISPGWDLNTFKLFFSGLYPDWLYALRQLKRAR